MARPQNQPQIDLTTDRAALGDIFRNIRRFQRALPANVPYTLPEWIEVLSEKNVLEMLVCLNDLLQKASDAINGDLRVRFSDDVQITDDVKDVTDLISKVRSAAVHISSKNNYIGNVKFEYNIAVGKGNVGKIGGVALCCDYDDDTALFYGQYRVYVQRHLYRAFNEVVTNLLPFLRESERVEVRGY